MIAEKFRTFLTSLASGLGVPWQQGTLVNRVENVTPNLDELDDWWKNWTIGGRGRGNDELPADRRTRKNLRRFALKIFLRFLDQLKLRVFEKKYLFRSLGQIA